MSTRKKWINNSFLVFGVALLAWFGVAELQGMTPDPLIPALSALFIGSTAVLDRLGKQKFE